MMKFNANENWLIVGLGNPGREYEKTRHNCGFRAIDILAQQLNVKIDKLKFQGLYTQVNYGGGKLFLLKPQTYMNLSGRSVLQLSAYFHIPPQRIIVMFDDISLEPGRLRIRPNGSAGGHNGIKSIIQELGSQEFPRVKIGVGAKPDPNYDLATGCFPLSPPTKKRPRPPLWKMPPKQPLPSSIPEFPKPPSGLTERGKRKSQVDS